MPRLIDADERNALIGAACLRVLQRDGLAALSVRKVADSAGIAAASLRRAFPTQNSLREHCLLLIEERATARIAALTSTGRALAMDILEQLMPLDEERSSELAAQVQLGVLAHSDAQLRPAVRRLDESVARACGAVVALLSTEGLVASHRDPDVEAERLHALLDGIALHCFYDQERHAPARGIELIDLHLAGLQG